MEPRGEAQSGSVFIPGFEQNFYPVISPVRAFDLLLAACLSAAFRLLPKLSAGGLDALPAIVLYFFACPLGALVRKS